jgi:hypothetical protein
VKNESSTVVPKKDILMKKNEFPPVNTPVNTMVPKAAQKPLNRGEEAAKARARAMLAKLKPFDRWVATMTDLHKSRVKSLGLELREFYDLLVASMTQESIDPTPTRIFVPHNGSQAKSRMFYD